MKTECLTSECADAAQSQELASTRNVANDLQVMVGSALSNMEEWLLGGESQKQDIIIVQKSLTR